MADAGAQSETFPGGWTAFDDPGFVALSGPIYHRTRDDRRDFAFRAEGKHGNLVGIVHGGMLATFADRALSIVARDASDGAMCVTIDMSLQFIGAAQIGELIETTPELLRKASSLVFVRGLLTSGDRPLAAVSGTWKVVREKPRS